MTMPPHLTQRQPLQIGIQSLAALAVFSGCLLNAVTLDDYPHRDALDPSRFAEEVESFLDSDRTNPPPKGAVVGIGSSSMRLWHPRIPTDLEGLTVIPRGFGGSEFFDVIQNADRLIVAYEPRAVVVYEGDNDSHSGKSPERIRDDLAFLVSLCRTSLPELRFYVIGVKPSIARENIWSEVIKTNNLMEAYCDETEGVTYIDIAASMLTETGAIRTDIFVEDNLHLNSLGYDLWSSTIAPVLLRAERPFERGAGDPNSAASP